MTYIEALISMVILATSMLAIMSLWSFSMNMATANQDQGQAYNLSRRTVEDLKAQGFDIAPEGEVVRYYNSVGVGGGTTQASDSVFKVVQTITSDKFTTTPTGTRPANNALRSVLIRVYKLPDDEVLIETGTSLVRSGV